MVFKKKYQLILSFILIVFIIGFNFSPNVEASSCTYKVYNLTISGGKVNFGSAKLTTTDFEKAKTEMNKHKDGVITSSNGLSPDQIVAARRGQAQSFPYRTGKDDAGATLKIYTNKALSSTYSYIPAHYMMYVYNYFLHNGRIVADIEIQGARGYVEVDRIDIIPLIYIENGIEIKIGGNADYRSSQNETYSIVPYQEQYKVAKNGNVNEISVYLPRPYPGLSVVHLTYGIAPDYLKSGGTYYSPDGIKFYSDRDLKNRVGDKDYYSYFQWLPVRSMTNHSKETLKKYLEDTIKNIKDSNGKPKKSVMTGETDYFIEQGLKYGMNPVLIFHQANLESAHGTSDIAKNKNNIFGWGAVDSNPSDGAESYSAIAKAISIHMSSQIAGYMNITDYRHYGPAFGNKSAGITVRYASDPYYGIKVASLCYRMDRANGYKDYNAYNLSLLEDGKQYSVKNASNNKERYKTKAGLKNQVLINLERKDKKITTIPWTKDSNGEFDITSEFAYIEDPNSKIIDIDSQGKVENIGPPSQEIKYEKPVKATTTSNLSLRESYTTASSRILIIPKGTELVVERTNVGWARTTYKGKIGYVHVDYLKMGNPVVKYNTGDINGDGKIDGFDMMEIKRHYLNIKKLTGDQLIAADINNDGIVDGFDMMEIKRHYLGIKKIKG